jgi:hypothetical protein
MSMQPSWHTTRSPPSHHSVGVMGAASTGVALKLVDFGGCFSVTETDTERVGYDVQTLPYRAPEVSSAL